jgi:hypothetical protein
MSIHNYTRARVGDEWDTSVQLLTQEVKTALPGKVFTLRAGRGSAGGQPTDLTFDFVDVLTAGEITTLDATVAANLAAGPYPTPTKPRQRLTLRSPDGSKWRISVTNAGVLQVNSVP